MPYTDNKPDKLPAPPIGFVAVRDAVARYQDAAVLVVSADGTDVSLAPVRQALEEKPDGFLMVFGTTPPVER
jgi:hypothetical protein